MSERDGADPDPDVGDRAQTACSLTLIRAALLRKALADVRQRGALARRLDLADTDILAIQHLALNAELTPSQLAARLQLSSAGSSCLVQRLQDAGHVTRRPHPHDKRSLLVRLTPSTAERLAEAWQPHAAELDALARDLTARQRCVLGQYLHAAADAAERHADRVGRVDDTGEQADLIVALPALWG